MASIAGDDVDLYEAVLEEAKRRGELHEISSDEDRLRRIGISISIFRKKNEERLDVAERTWQIVQLLAERYGLVPWRRLSSYNSAGERAELGREDPFVAVEWTQEDQRFEIPEWRALNPNIRPEDMSRHFLILGETGSGKSKSAVIPLLKAALSYHLEDPELRPAMLVIDPKFELRAQVHHILATNGVQRPIIELDLQTDKYVLPFHDASEHVGGVAPTEREIVDLALQLSPDAARILSDPDQAFWASSARDLLANLMAVDNTARRMPAQHSIWYFWTAEAKEHNAKQSTKDGDGVLIPPIAANYTNYYRAFQEFILFAGACQELAWRTLRVAGLKAGVSDILLGFCGQRQKLSTGEHGSVISTVTSFLGVLANDSLARLISLDPLSAKRSDNRIVLNLETCIDQGAILIYSPGSGAKSSIADAIGRSLKTKFFQATFRRLNKRRPVFYICDEFQRFITSDSDSGDQSFLDRCRAFRAVCVLATQSLASLQHTLSAYGDPKLGDSALDIVLNNTGNKLFFRNTDINTVDRLGKLLPTNPLGGPHVVSQRPLATLSVGECYYVMSDGSWGRTRVELSGGASAEASRSRDIGSHRLKDDVSLDSVFELCDKIENMIEYLQYRKIRIEVDSRGGSLQAFDYFYTKLEQWRLKGVSVETLGLTKAMSAGALILSIGDVGKRKAYSSTTLLYHNGRIPMGEGTMLTREGARDLQRVLGSSDKRYINMLVQHIVDNSLISERYRQLASIYKSRKYPSKLSSNDIDSLDRVFAFVADPRREVTIASTNEREFLYVIYEALLIQDAAISSSLAKALLLIDEIVDEPAEESVRH